MKLEEDRLSADIRAGRIERVYFLYGKEPFLVKTYVDRLIKKTVGEDALDFNLVRISGNPDMDMLSDHVDGLPVFADMKLISVNDIDPEKIEKEAFERLLSIIADVPETTILLFNNTGVSPDERKSQTKKFIAAVEIAGVVCKMDAMPQPKIAELVIKKAVQVLKNLSEFAMKYKGMPCLAYTHLQPAQLTTVGKRATLWMYELEQDIKEMQHRLDELLLLGSKGTTGTQASFIELFEGDEEKVKALEEKIAKSMNFKGSVAVSGQTYSRKTDAYFLAVLSGFAQSAYKFSNDLRLLQSFEEMEEPFEKNQIGSSAMPYKRNPMRSERISSLARYVIIDSLNP